MAKSSPPQPTEFERIIPRRRSYIEAARLYVRRHGLDGAQDAIHRDMRAGRLPRHKAEHMLGYLLFLLIERVCRRIGYNDYGALLLDPEFIHEMAVACDSRARVEGPFSSQQREQFAQQAASDALTSWHFVAQDLAGNPIYEVTAALAQVLREQPARELACATLRLPVPALTLVVPAEAGLTLAHDDGQRYRVTDLNVVETPAPERRWFLWLCAPMDEQAVLTEHLNIALPENSSLEHSLQQTETAYASGAVTHFPGWQHCVRFVASAMRYLSAGGAHHELWLDEEVRQLHQRLAQLGPHKHKQREVLHARLQTMDAGRRIVLGAQA